MAGFNVYQDSYIGATIISNRFIDEYMNDANDAQLKVYLYLVRMLNAHLETSVADIADRFNHTEKDVLRAFSYWEKQGLLTLDYDENKTLVGVHLVNLCKGEAVGPSVESTHNKVKQSKPSKSNAKVAASESVEPFEARSAEAATEPETVSDGDVSAPQMSSQDIKDEFAIEDNSVKVSKPSYSMRELADFKEKRGSQILFLAQTYFGRPISQTDVESLCFITDELGLSEDLVDYLLQYCAEKGKTQNMRFAESVAIKWKDRGVTSVSQAANCSFRYDPIVYTIMNRLGKNGSPADKEIDYIQRWIKDYGFSESVIFEACDRAVMGADSHRFEYAEKIFSEWNERGVRNLEDVKRLDENYHNKNAGKKVSGNTSDNRQNGTAQYSGRSASQKSSAAAFGNFKQNDIDFDALAKKVFAN